MPASAFVEFVPPPRHLLDPYDRARPRSEQPGTVPARFRDAMAVREAVFVAEQRVPLACEYDDADAHSFHWVAYASLAPPSPGEPADHAPAHYEPRTVGPERGAEMVPATTCVPVGTVRMVPPARAPADAALPIAYPPELHAKLGRLCVLADFRGSGLAALLIRSALDFARRNRTSVQGRFAAELEAAQRSALGRSAVWNGLFLVHAQLSAAGVWTRAGFAAELRENRPGGDEVVCTASGVWNEDGIAHTAMWKRVDLR